MIGLNIQTSFLTPPFGFALFYLRGVATKAVKTLDMYKGVVPFIALQILGLAIVGFNPSLVNYLPTKTFYRAKPHHRKNPRLQLCLEGYLFDFYENNKKEYLTKLDPLQSSDMSMLPQSKRQILSSSIKSADMIFASVDDIKNAKTAMDNAAVAYLPIHSSKKTERKIAQLQKEIGQLRRDLRNETSSSERNGIQSQIVELQDETSIEP